MKISFSLQKEEDFQKQIKKNDTIVLKAGPIMLRLCCATCLDLPTPLFYSVSAKERQFLRTPHRTKQAPFVSTTVLTTLFKMSFYCAFFSFGGGFEFPLFGELVCDSSQKSRNKKIQMKTNKNNKKHKMQIIKK